MRSIFYGKKFSLLFFLLIAAGVTVFADTSSHPIPPTFFGLTAPMKAGTPWPPFPFGSLGTLGKHPSDAWSHLEPEKGQFDWSNLDHAVDEAESHGVHDIVYSFLIVPHWASTRPDEPCWMSKFNSRFNGCAAPPDPEAWKDFVRAIVTRYKGRIRYYEIWNEPNRPQSWSGSIEDMVALAQAAYPIIKSIDPQALVLTPGTAGGEGNVSSRMRASLWMENYLKAGGAAYADVGTFHGYLAQAKVRPYPFPEEDSTSGCVRNDCTGSILTKAHAMRAVMDQNGMADKPLWDSEGSWGKNTITDPDEQIAWLARWYLLQAGIGVERAYWFAWGITANSGNTWGALLEQNGPTPAAGAYGQVYHWLVGATFQGPCSGDSDHTWTCHLTRPGGYEALAVWNTAGTPSYTPPGSYTRYRDLAGETHSINGSVTLGIKPILLETSAPAP